VKRKEEGILIVMVVVVVGWKETSGAGGRSTADDGEHSPTFSTFLLLTFLRGAAGRHEAIDDVISHGMERRARWWWEAP
jgi:hypothetical protein